MSFFFVYAEVRLGGADPPFTKQKKNKQCTNIRRTNYYFFLSSCRSESFALSLGGGDDYQVQPV